jgi:fructuronate reductase
MRLSRATIDRLPAGVARPAFDVDRLGVGIVHLGIGAFHRAHQAIYTDDAIATAGGDWGICGVSLRTPDTRDRLLPQDGLYTAVEKSPAATQRRVVGSVRELLFAAEQANEVHARLASPAVSIVTLTVTEKGYCHDPATGKLNLAHPDIVHDFAHPEVPRSTVGVLIAALAARRRTHGKPLTIICCDNLPKNGALLLGLVATYSNALDPALERWIADNAAFPSTMVDRIVPATTAEDIAENDAAIGLQDLAPVVYEPFEQWVIEDRFATPRPVWERVGAQLVRDVTAFEKMKLRLLNASHSAFAYLGFLAGFTYIYEVAARPEFVALMRRYTTEEAIPTVHVPGVDLAAYRDALIVRFGNPALPHRTQQVAMDGSQKLPQRILAPVRENLAHGRSVRLASLAIAGWMRYASGEDEAGRPIAVSDPLADTFREIAARARGDPDALAQGFLGIRAVFDEDLHNEPRFAKPVTEWLRALFADGAARTVARAVSERPAP